MMSEAYGGKQDDSILLLQYCNEYDGDLFDFESFVAFVKKLMAFLPA